MSNVGAASEDEWADHSALHPSGPFSGQGEVNHTPGKCPSNRISPKYIRHSTAIPVVVIDCYKYVFVFELLCAGPICVCSYQRHAGQFGPLRCSPPFVSVNCFFSFLLILSCTFSCCYHNILNLKLRTPTPYTLTHTHTFAPSLFSEELWWHWSVLRNWFVKTWLTQSVEKNWRRKTSLSFRG